MVSSKDIENNKVRADLGITYEEDVFRLIRAYSEKGLYVSSVVITQYTHQKATDRFARKLTKHNIKVYHHYYIEGYPTNPKMIISKQGFGKNDYVETSQPLVVVTAPGPGSGKMATCLSQLYHENVRGIKAGYAKFETFPIWNLELNHPVNLAYEAATADLNDVNMIDPFHLEAYQEVTVNYNRDVEIYPVLEKIFEEIFGECPYKSPTDMGVNMAGNCISNDQVCKDASKQEIIRRYFDSRTRYYHEDCGIEEVQKQELIMEKADAKIEDRHCVIAARKKEKETGVFSGAIELADGTMVMGKTTDLMGTCSSTLINALKVLAGIEDVENLISPEAFGPIQQLKTDYLGNRNPRLHTNEILIALSLSAQENTHAQKALQQMAKLKGLQAHFTTDVSPVDLSVYQRLGLQVTYETEKR